MQTQPKNQTADIDDRTMERMMHERGLVPPVESPALARAQSTMALVGAAVLGLLLASVSVFATFLVFNFILHWGA